MSFILDALRKSEAARRRNETPDLFTPMPERAGGVESRPAWPMWLVGGAGLVSLAIAIGLFVQREPATPAPAVAQAPAAQPAPLPQAPVVDTTQAPSPMPGPRPDLQPASGPAVVGTPPPVTAPQPPSPTPVQRPAQAALPLPPQNAPTQPAPPVELPPAPLPPPRPAAHANDNSALAMNDLDPGTRKQLPPMKLSMHLWNETPSRRFVILDGQRLGEGDMIRDVMVESITRDGVVLNWQGTRLKLDMR